MNRQAIPQSLCDSSLYTREPFCFRKNWRKWRVSARMRMRVRACMRIVLDNQPSAKIGYIKSVVTEIYGEGGQVAQA